MFGYSAFAALRMFGSLNVFENFISLIITYFKYNLLINAAFKP